MVDFCCQYLEREVTEDNYLYLQELALLYSLERLDSFIDKFILSRFATLSFTPDFLRDIPLHKLTSYLSSSQVSTTPPTPCVTTRSTLCGIKCTVLAYSVTNNIHTTRVYVMKGKGEKKQSKYILNLMHKVIVNKEHVGAVCIMYCSSNTIQSMDGGTKPYRKPF